MHWRTYRGDEVDLVVEHGRRVVAIEAKATRRPAAEDVRGLRAFLKGSPQAAGLLVHGTAQILRSICLRSEPSWTSRPAASGEPLKKALSPRTSAAAGRRVAFAAIAATRRPCSTTMSTSSPR